MNGTLEVKGNAMKSRVTRSTGWLALGLALVLGAIAVHPARAAECDRQFFIYEDFALFFGLATVQGGGVVYIANGNALDDFDGDGLLNSQEFEGWGTTDFPASINDQPTSFSWSVLSQLSDSPYSTCGPDPRLPDTDFDGLSDRAEFLPNARINPRNDDSDGDGMFDQWETYVGLDAAHDGLVRDTNFVHTGEYTSQWQYADPDGDGISNIEEMTGINSGYPDLVAAPPGVLSTTPYFNEDDRDQNHSEPGTYTLPLDWDSDGDGLIDSYEYECNHNLDPADPLDDKDADPDGDGLSTFREQVLHPLLAQAWSSEITRITSWVSATPNKTVAEGVTRFNGSVTLSPTGEGGYLHKAQADGPLNFFPPALGQGPNIWGMPIVATCVGVNRIWTDDEGNPGVRRWTDPTGGRPTGNGYDTDNDLLPDGFELEHGLNPLSGLLTATGNVEPSGGLADPDNDTLLSYDEYLGQDGYRVSIFTGSGDESNPWITRAINRRYETEFMRWVRGGGNVGNTNIFVFWSGGSHRAVQAPSEYLGLSFSPAITNESFSTAFAPEVMPGFYDAAEFVGGALVPVPGVPPYVFINDQIDGTSSRFNPFATAQGDLVFIDNDGNGGFTPGVDDYFIDEDIDTIYNSGTDTLVVNNSNPTDGTQGLPLTDSKSVRWPMPGADTDDDGLPDQLEIQADVANGKDPSSPVMSLSPFVPRAAFITGTNALLLNNADRAEEGLYLFSRDWTLECWVYLRDQGTNEYRGSFIRGDVAVGSVFTRIGYELGVTNSSPYVAFQSLSGKRYQVSSPGKLAKNRWIHMAGVFDHHDNALSLYLDGVLDQSRQVLEESSSYYASSIDGHGGTARLAFDQRGSAPFANNLWIDEVRIWAVPRSAEEIGNNLRRLVDPFQYIPVPPYDSVMITNENALSAYFSFDDGGLTAEDFTKRAGTSMQGYKFPQDPDVAAGPNSFVSLYAFRATTNLDVEAEIREQFLYGEYIYSDQGYAIDSDTIRGPGQSFVFDANNAAPVIGAVDGERGAQDSDRDGLPDAWEVLHELNPYKTNSPEHIQAYTFDSDWGTNSGPTTDSVSDLERPTPDKLGNLFEYFARTNPRKNDTDEDGRIDRAEDFDEDGLPNGVEFQIGSRPDLADTDDDSVEDSVEQANETSPISSIDPPRLRAVFLDGEPGTYLDVAERAAMRLASWTIEASILPSGYTYLANNEGAGVVRRTVQEVSNGLLASDFELRIVRKGTNLVPELRYVTVEENGSGQIISAIATNIFLPIDSNDASPFTDGSFVRLSGTFDDVTGLMRLYVNGEAVAQRATPLTRPPLTGQGPRSFTRIGDGYRGFVKEVRLWGVSRTRGDILTTLNEILLGTETNLVSLYRFDDGGWPTRNILPGVLLSTNSPPPNALKGDRFLVVAPAVQAFAGHRHHIATAGVVSNSWTFQVPVNGDRLFNAQLGTTLQYIGSNDTWIALAALDVKEPTFAKSVRYNGAPVKPQDGDTWLAGGSLHRYDSGVDYAHAYAGPVFIEGFVINGPLNDRDFAWFVSRDEYFRRDQTLPPGVPSIAPGFLRWGPGVDWLADARWMVKAVIASTNDLPPEPFVGDVYYAQNPPSFHRYDGGSFVADPVLDHDRFLVESTGEVLDYEASIGDTIKIADGTTDGGQLYMFIRGLGAAMRSEGTASNSWRRWGFIPTSEDFTQPKGWTQQWSQAARLSGGVTYLEFGEDVRLAESVASSGDADDDGLPTGWETEHGLDPNDATGDNGADGDPDGDGLTNLFEYLSGSDPNDFDSNSNGLSDYEDDTDGDGIPNGAEQDQYLTDPSEADTDDDESTDLAELLRGTDPNESRSPYLIRALSFDGRTDVGQNVVTVRDRINGRDTLRLSQSTWTVELMISPSNLPPAGVQWPIVSRRVANTGFINYEIGISNSFLYVRFNEVGTGREVRRQSGNALPTNKWTHVAGRFDQGVLSLLVDGVVISATDVTAACAVGAGDLVIGTPGFAGELRDIRIWKIGRTDQDIRDFMTQSLFFGFRAADAGYLQVSGNGHVKENSTTTTVGNQLIDDLSGNWTLEAWVRVTTQQGDGQAIIIARRNGSVSTGTDFNYALGVTTAGRLRGRFAIEYEDEEQNTIINTELNVMEGEVFVADGRWHHVAYVRDDSGCRLFVDGLLDASQTRLFVPAGAPVFNPRVRGNPGPLVIGEGLRGNVDEARVWARGLTAVELREVNTRNLRGNEDELISYFSFDYQTGTTADDRSKLRNPVDEVGLYIGDAVLVRDSVNAPPIIIDPVKIYADIALVAYFAADDGGESLEDYIHQLGVLPFDGRDYVGEIFPGVRFVQLTGSRVPFTIDSDLDGIPDWWESSYGISAATAEGVNGAWGDPDQDGMPNIAEYRVLLDTGLVSDPLDPDSLGTGNGDFFNWDDTVGLANRYRIFGEIYTDFDGMDDAWEVDEGLDPRAFDSHVDKDLDQWSNLAEFLANVNLGDYSIGRSVLPDDITSWPRPNVRFSFAYSGFRDNGVLRVHAYQSAAMDGIPSATFEFSGLAGAYPRSVTANIATNGFLREGKTWFFAYYDNNNNNTWNEGEPAGLSRRQPQNIRFNSAIPIEIDLLEAQPNFSKPDYELPGYGRFSWPAVAIANNYQVTIRNKSLNGSPVALQRNVAAPRTYFHENDYLYAGQPGLSQATYEWFVRYTQNGSDVMHTSGVFTVTFPAAPSAPVPATPNGTIWRFAQNDLQWQETIGGTHYQLQIAKDTSFTQLVTNHIVLLAVPDANGKITVRAPVRAGDENFGNGTYYWRVRGFSVSAISPWSGVQSVGINLTDTPAGPYSISGRLVYFGKVTNGTFVVTAHTSPDFSLEPVAQIVVPNMSRAAGWPTNAASYSLRGLTPGTYYVRAWLDQNGDRARSAWESVGFARENAYMPRPIVLPASAVDQDVLIVFADTDNDRIADDWEFQYWGNLTTAGAGPLRGYTDHTPGDNISDFESYAATPMNLSPIDPYAAGPDGIPVRVKNAFGMNPYEDWEPMIASITLDSQKRPAVRWDRDTKVLGTIQGGTGGMIKQVNAGVEVRYQVQYSSDLKQWINAPAQGVVTYDAASNQFQFVNGNVSSNGMYRYKVQWSY